MILHDVYEAEKAYYQTKIYVRIGATGILEEAALAWLTVCIYLFN